MSRTLIYLFRAIVFLLIQVLILKGIQFENPIWMHFHFFVYPVVIFLFPIDMNKIYVIFFAFVLGLIVDGFYDSPGVHAFACLSVAYLRSTVINFLEPRGGYSQVIPGLGTMEIMWIISYMSIMSLLFLLIYFSVEAFSYIYIGTILLKTICSFVIMISIILVYQIIFKTRV